MESTLTTLTEALQGSLVIALLASFAWGVASVLLSPCHLSSIPLIVGFLTAKSEKKTLRGFLVAFIFALGILISIAVIGVITAGIGRIIGDIGDYGKYIVSAVFFVVGLHLMDLVRLPQIGPSQTSTKPAPLLRSAFLLGLIFGIALGPCTFAFLAPVLGVVFQLSKERAILSGTFLLAFSIGHCSVLVVAGGLTSRVQAYLDWTNRSRSIVWIKRASGLLVIGGGVYNIAA